MAFQLSPGVNFSEIDLTNATAAVATTEGAIAGVFRWGPINERTLITSENQLVDVFGAPSSRYVDANQTDLWTNAETFYTAANFLGYSDALYVTRVVETLDSTEVDGVANANRAEVASNSAGTISGKYYGELGNSLTVSYCKGTTAGLEAFNGKQYSGGAANIVPATGSKTATITGLTSAADGNDIDAGDIIEILDSNGDVIQAMTVATDVAPGGGTALFTINAQGLQAITGTLPEDAVVSEGVIINANADNAGLATLFEAANTNVVNANNEIALIASGDHGLTAGDAVTFAITSGTGAPLTSGGNLTAGTYYVVAGSDTTKIKLATTFANATAETPVVIDLADASGTAGTYTFTTTGDQDTTTVNELKRSNIIILESAQSVFKGQPIKFTGTDVALPTGLVSGQTYFAIPVDNTTGQLGELLPNTADSEGELTVAPSTNAIKLATTYAAAEAYTDASPTNLAITAGATAGTSVKAEAFAITTATVTFTTKYTGIKTAGLTFKKFWGDYELFDEAPSGDANLHVVVKDSDGKISGKAGTVLETFSNVSENAGDKSEDGTSNHITDVLENNSKWITVTTANSNDLAGDYINSDPITGGRDGNHEGTISLGDLATGYDLYKDASDVDVSFILQGKARGGTTLSNYIIDNITSVRRDCVAFISPEYSDDTAQEIVDFASTLTASTYAVVDSGYKYQYDKFTDVYRWIPLNGDIAGLCARTDDQRDPWFSPAGYSRGNVKNVVKLKFNPNKAQRDLLYKNNINPVITQPGQGTVLFGDKTYAPNVSAFDRINVRRLFIVLEKTISRAAKASLFEFNDEFTRAQFTNLVEPFLRDVQGRRGIYDFKVICDESNNTGQVIDTNSFVGDIYIKPARSINFIQLNFVAVRTGVEFSEVVGAA